MSGDTRDRAYERESRSKPEPLVNKQYPCRLCGKMSKNRFYCPEHLRVISDGIGEYGSAVVISSGGQKGRQE